MHKSRRRWGGARCRWEVSPGEWSVRARIERFGEPAVLLFLHERPAHGYDLLDPLASLTGERRADMGNLYRALRALEDERIVSSEWRDDLPGPSKRVYELTEAGRGLLDQWAKALREVRQEIDEFLERYEQAKEVEDVRA
jgi:PadR family transcriptional regulator, regulatory protein PadR